MNTFRRLLMIVVIKGLSFSISRTSENKITVCIRERIDTHYKLSHTRHCLNNFYCYDVFL